MHILNRIFLLVFIGVCLSCVGTKGTSSDASGAKEVAPQYNQLIDYLRRVPGLQITQRGDNYSITVRGMGSINAQSEPLFVIDGVQVGTYNQAASLVDPNNIRYVNVLKDVASTAPYGMRGANGVVVIYTKK